MAKVTFKGIVFHTNGRLPQVGRPAPDFIIRRMQRNGKRKLQLPVCEVVDLVDEPAGGKRNMPHTNIKPVF